MTIYKGPERQIPKDLPEALAIALLEIQIHQREYEYVTHPETLATLMEFARENGSDLELWRDK